MGVHCCKPKDGATDLANAVEPPEKPKQIDELGKLRLPLIYSASDVEAKKPEPCVRADPAPEEMPPPASLPEEALESSRPPVSEGGSTSSRGRVFRVPLRRPDCSKECGLVVGRAPKGEGLRVKHVKAGVVADWNVMNPEQCVCVGAVIMEVNGAAGDCRELLSGLRKDGDLVLTVCDIERP
eukprot:NODE_20833_length_780_cov_4.531394.p2 GENE.NODE_20833_length_780_cov_4.531394~~NODE_20833_length_780_cov_4.531394.p2  ORF type:complete len:194 (+),score=52.57 NODE_20833_length_780_cov_4.531394:38-583(+)